MIKLLLATLILFCSTHNCFGQANSNTSPAPFSIKIKGPSQIKSGAEIEVRVQLTNDSDHSVDASAFYMGGVDFQYDYDIRDKDGKSIEARAKPKGGSIVTVTLAPGESREEGTLVNRAFAMTQPGEYEIQLSRAVSSGATDTVVKSNKITVKVTQ
jgi:hypothetical protein